LLFDNCIGRKRDVGGEVLALRDFSVGWSAGFKLAGLSGGVPREETIDGHVSKFIALWRTSGGPP